MPVGLLLRASFEARIPAAVRRAAAARLRVALAALGRGRSSATLVLTDDAEIRTLNRRWRRVDHATDVLSFPVEAFAGEADPAANGAFLGDIVISVETARRRAGPRRLGAEIQRLAVHGLCHLFGHDHKRPGEARRMFALEARLRGLPLGPPPRRFGGLSRAGKGRILGKSE